MNLQELESPDGPFFQQRDKKTRQIPYYFIISVLDMAGRIWT